MTEYVKGERMGYGTQTTGLKTIRETKMEDPYDWLAKAIVKQAVIDYRDTLSKLHKALASGAKDDGLKLSKLMYERRKLEEFFESDYCDLLCGFDGSIIIEHISQEWL